jgi:hypothetical protein
VIIQDKFIFPVEILEIEGDSYSPIIIDKSPAMEESPASGPDRSSRDAGGVSVQGVKTPAVIFGPGRTEQPVDVNFSEKSLTIAASRVYHGKGISGMKGIIKTFPI